MLTLIASILVFGIIVIFHELGHFSVAKIIGIRVKEFAIGFGPTIINKERGETLYSVRAFPLGGFVKLSGEDEASDDERSFGNFPVLARMAVIAAGPIMNFVLTAIIFFSLAFFVGIPTETTVIGEVLPDGVAIRSGIQTHDKILTIDGVHVNNWSEVVTHINKNPETEIEITVKRNNYEELNFILIPAKDEETGLGKIGIVPTIRRFGLVSSIKDGISRTIWLTLLWISSIFQIITGSAPAEVVGPVGIVQMVGEAARLGVVNLMFLAGLLSINLGLINLLPIPALDGSRLIFLAIEGIRRKPIDPEKEGFIHFIGFALLMILMVFIAYRDIINLNIFR